MKNIYLASFAAALLLGCGAPSMTRANTVPAPIQKDCPAEWPVGSRCFTGVDVKGAWYAVGIPPQWDREVLVVHAHGGPDLDQTSEKRVLADLKRWAITGRAGHAWIASSYRSGGYGWTAAGEDVETSRQLFVQRFGPARRTILHGQSYGGGVAAKLAERAGSSYDAVLLTNGMLGGGTRYLEFRFDLRVVYQHVCRNHPRPDEKQYPLWMGLPADSKLTLAELTERVNECTGARLPAAQRTSQQQRNLADIVNVVRIREDSLVRHMEQSTWLFRDLTLRLLGGRNPFDNTRVEYRGSSDDTALNAGVARYAADPQAVADLARDSAPTGKVGLPVLTLHAIDDPTAFVELESAYRQALDRAGSADKLVQVFTEEREHSYLSDPEYPTMFTALLRWIDGGERPTPGSVARLCAQGEERFGKGCLVRPEYIPAPLESRVAPRR